MTYARWLYLASLITFTFGALTFSALAGSYWKERRTRHSRGGSRVLPVFTLVCGAAFLLNLLRAANDRGLWPAAASGVSAGVALLTGLLPPLSAHLIFEEEGGSRRWRFVLAGLYIASACGAIANTVAEADWLDSLAPALLACAALTGLFIQGLSRRPLPPAGRRRRHWNRGLLLLMLASGAGSLAFPDSLWTLLPDYLVLAFFCVALYYTQRLAFFDVLIKGGAMFGLCLAGLTLWFAAAPPDRLSADWSRPWIAALLLSPLWLAAPWIYARLSRSIDRAWLGRRYSAAEAERRFAQAVQAAADEDDLRNRATASLAEIFEAPVEVRFARGAAPAGGLAVELEPDGFAAVSERPNGIPFLSDDRRLLQSVARTLAVVLENTRFRQQRRRHEEREQELRLLASRAELKALRAQINPHFLFNALNAIAGLIPGRPELAEQTVERLAEVFRYTLRKSEKEWVRLDEEMEFIEAYLEVEQARFGDRLRVEFQIDSAAGAASVPAMSIQPLVENAIKHGVSELEEGGTAGVRARMDGDALCVEVFDNGPGFPPGFKLQEAGATHGLRNVADRLRAYYGGAARLSWRRSGDWTEVSFRIPCEAAEGSAAGRRS